MIVVSAGAGGHGGTLNPISLISEVETLQENFYYYLDVLVQGKI